MKKTHLLVAFMLMMLLSACGGAVSGIGESDATSPRYPERRSCNGIYFWKTTFALDSCERAFLKRHDVGRMYVRFFDVVEAYDNQAIPNATISFRDSVPDGVEIVPTVFVTVDVLRKASLNTNSAIESVAEKIAKRVMAMCKAHGLKHVREVQIDCDWTAKH